MPTKVRKQIYLEPRQNRQLKRLAEARGVSEAAVIRELIDAGAAAAAATALPPDRAAWEEFVQFARQRAQSGATGEPYKWNRQEIYDERESRYGSIIRAAASPASDAGAADVSAASPASDAGAADVSAASPASNAALPKNN